MNDAPDWCGQRRRRPTLRNVPTAGTADVRRSAEACVDGHPLESGASVGLSAHENDAIVGTPRTVSHSSDSGTERLRANTFSVSSFLLYHVYSYNSFVQSVVHLFESDTRRSTETEYRNTIKDWRTNRKKTCTPNCLNYNISGSRYHNTKPKFQGMCMTVEQLGQFSLLWSYTANIGVVTPEGQI